MELQNLSKLEPKLVWKHFDEIRKIPRASQQEEAMRNYIIQFAKANNLSYDQDNAGNLVVRKPGSKGKEKVAITVLQSHMDMVCEKNKEVQHDFSKDPLRLNKEGDYLYAIGTTLGADNGIGLAASLAVLESKDLVHGPIECLFTTDEETGLNGARGLTAEFIKGRRMLNLDSEEEGSIYIGCAGGGGTNIKASLEYQPRPANTECFQVTIKGLQGGHSGVDIHLGRGNAIEILVRVLEFLSHTYPVYIHSLQGGDKHNAIPREAVGKIAVLGKDKDTFAAAANKLIDNIKGELGKKDPGLALVWESSAPFEQVLSGGCQSKLIGMLKSLPHGVLAMNPDIPELVNTSVNLAKIQWQEKECLVHCSSRSSLKDALEATRFKVAAIGALAGAAIDHNEAYPGWKPNLDSNLLGHAKEMYKKVYGKEPKIKAIHAGLECGIIGEKVPGMDMVSIGPQIENPHSPQERVQIPSVEKFWKVLVAILAKIAA